MRMIRYLHQIVFLTLIFSFSVASSALSSKDQRLVNVLQHDSSFKVRLQALRILSKRMRASKKTIKPTELIDVLGTVANTDKHYMVRGMACFVLGQLAAPGSEKYLVSASQDKKAFVRVQAESALTQVRQHLLKVAPVSPTMVDTSTGARSLVFAVEAMPGAKIPKSMIEQMSDRMSENLKEASDSTFRFYNERSLEGSNRLGVNQAAAGYKIRSSIAERSLIRGDGRALRISIVVRVTITTWPGNSLRHVISAKASGTVSRADPKEIERVEAQVLAGAVDQAVSDIMTEISRS
jgi:hypothetical protein